MYQKVSVDGQVFQWSSKEQKILSLMPNKKNTPPVNEKPTTPTMLSPAVFNFTGNNLKTTQITPKN